MSSDFERNLKWSNGDLLYGISGARGKYLREYFKKEYNQSLVPKSFGYIDNYNNAYFCNDLEDLDPFAMRSEIQKLFPEQLKSMTSRSGLPRYNEYVRALAASKYSPRTTLMMNAYNVLKKEGLLDATENLMRQYIGCKDPDSSGAQAILKKVKILLQTAYQRKAIRRGCKFGIQMVAMNLNSELPNAKIHFLLDGIDMKSVIDKTDKPETEAGGVHVSYRNIYITNTELRSAYRYWYTFDQTRVLFYLRGDEVGAPWQNAWKNKKDWFDVKRTNDPAWWRVLVGQEKVRHGPPVNYREIGRQSNPPPEPIKLGKYQKIRQQWESRIKTTS